MSSANILGVGNYSGSIGSDDLFKFNAIVALPAGAGPQVSAAQTVPYMKSSDTVVVSYQCGATVAGPIVVSPVANAGLVNASFTITSTGAVGAGGASMLVQVFAGRSG
jgi:hypothetical protein